MISICYHCNNPMKYINYQSSFDESFFECKNCPNEEIKVRYDQNNKIVAYTCTYQNYVLYGRKDDQYTYLYKKHITSNITGYEPEDLIINNLI